MSLLWLEINVLVQRTLKNTVHRTFEEKKIEALAPKKCSGDNRAGPSPPPTKEKEQKNKGTFENGDFGPRKTLRWQQGWPQPPLFVT